MNIQKRYILALVILSAAGGYTLRQLTAQPETVTQTKEVIKDKIVTVVRTVKSPDGTVVEDRTSTEDRLATRDTLIAVTPPRDWLAGVGYTRDQFYSAQVARRVLGPAFIGLSADTSGRVGVNLIIEF